MRSGSDRAFLIISLLALIVVGVGVFAMLVLPRGEEKAQLDMRDTSDVTIVLTDEGFTPENILIRLGTTVTFTSERDGRFWPASDTHPSHDIFPAFDPHRPLDSGESWSFHFERPGIWGFHDHIRSYYVGTITVEE